MSRDGRGDGREPQGGLLEREREVASLDALVSGIAKPGARIGLIEGPAGIGKTSLLAEAKRLAESDGLRILSARGSGLEREFPYGVVRQLFEPLLVDAKTRKAALAGAAAPAAPVFEALGEEPTGSADPGFSSLHGLYWLTLNLAGDDPLVLTVDDLHWCDRPSLRFLAYLGRRLEDTPLVIAGTLRPNEPGADMGLLAELANDPLAAVVRPGPLSRDGVAELIAARLGGEAEEAFATSCHTATGGNPLLLSELLKALASEGVEPVGANAGVVRDIGPRAASRAVLLRLARLPKDVAKVARAIAVLGEGAELWAVAGLAGLEEPAAAEATGTLARAEILRPHGALGFVHPLVRDAVYLELTPGQRELEHARAAELLHEAGAPAEQIAAHLLHTPRSGEEWAREVLTRAARSASGKGAADSAVAYLRRALDEPHDENSRAELLAELGIAEANTRGEDAAAHLYEAYEAASDPYRRARLAFILARTLGFTRGRSVDAYNVASRALAELPDDFDPDPRYALEAIRSTSILFGGGSHDELALLESYRDREAFAADGPGARSLAAMAAHYWSNMGGTGEECARLARWALESGELLEIENDNGLFWVIAAIVLIYAEDPYVREVWEVAQREAHRSGSLFQILSVNLWRGYNLLRWGELPEAEEAVLSALEEMRLWGAGQGTVLEFPAAFLCEIRVERGNLAGAREALEAATEIDPRSDGINYWRGARSELLLHEGRFEEALESCEEYRAALFDHMNTTPHPWRTLKAVILDRLGRTDEGIELALEEVETARAWGAPGPVGRALRVAGELAREDGLGYLEESVSILEDSVTRLQYAKSLCSYGAALRLARKPSEAREPLRQALELADVCGAAPLAERARAELHATGARPRREALSGAGALTPSERRVADLAAEGRTNREIAQELFVTPKTVEVHLSNAYRKLEIKGRRELAAALAGA